MDLFRIVTATGDIRKEIPLQSVREFINHALDDFEKIELVSREREIKFQISESLKELDYLQDPHKRLRWAENILTARCRL